MRAQFLYHVKHSIRQLYDLLDTPTAIARRVDYLLERDRFMYLPHGYEVGRGHLTKAEMTTNRATNVGPNLQVPCPADCGHYIWQVFRRNQNARHAGP